MANTRTHGANARTYDWSDYEEARPQRTGNWMPLDDLDEELYSGTPKLAALAHARRTARPQRPDRPQEQEAPTRAHPARAPRGEQVALPGAAQGQSVRGVQSRTLAVVAAVALSGLFLYVAATAFLEFTQVKLDDLQYGRPRTQQIDAYVGHNEAQGVPSHFIAINLNRRVVILEMPGGDSTKVNTIIGPYLFGQNEDLTPVQLAAQDLNGDDQADLIVTVKDEQLLYLNDGTAFRLATPEEGSEIKRSLEAKPSARASEPVDAALEAGK